MYILLIIISARVDSVTSGVPIHNANGSPSQLQIITDICSTLQTFANPCAGFYLESDGSLRGTYDVQQDVAYAEGLTKLDDVLRTKPGTISQQESYYLSTILTVSLLHLRNTPWLSGTWDKTQIAFLRVKGSASSGSVDIKQPFLIRKHQKTPHINPVGSPQPNDSSTLAALGVMLLEIYYRLPVESLDGLDISGTPPMQVDSVHRWVMEKESKGDLTFAFAKAIRFCLECFQGPNKLILEPEFSDAVDINVLKPLQEELNFIVHGPWGI